MDNNLKVVLILSALDKASAVIQKTFATAEKQAKTFEKVGKSFSDAGDSSLKAGAIMSAGLIGTLKTAADVERMQIALRTSFRGSATEADKAFKTIDHFAAATPYGVEEVMTAFIKLKNLGLDPGEKALESYGNTASAMGKSLNDMIEAVADAATGEFERLKEFGIKASSNGDYVTFLFQGQKTTIKKEAGQIEQYLQKIGRVNFAGGIEAQSHSLYGQWSTLTDNARKIASTLGKTLLPEVNKLFSRVGPLIDKIQDWIDNNPTLARGLMLTAAKVALFSLGAGLALKTLGFMFGGVGKILSGLAFIYKNWGGIVSTSKSIISGAIKVYKGFSFALFAVQYHLKFTIIPALKSAGTAVIRFGAQLLASPITWYVLAAIALGAAVYFIIKNWDKVAAFFARLWQAIKGLFQKFWGWAKWFFFNLTPEGLIIKHWSKLAAIFQRIWDGVKSVFSAAFNWIMKLGKNFFNAGKNIVNQIASGIKSVAMLPVTAIKNIVQSVRNHLPFSPAKVGPLKDINKIKLVETVAQNIKPRPLMDAWGKVTTSLRQHMQRIAVPEMPGVLPLQPGFKISTGTPTNTTASQVQNINITVNLTGKTSEKEGVTIADEIKKQLDRYFRDKKNYDLRVSF